MELKDQLTNLELSKRLKEMGYPQEGIFWWAVTIREIKIKYIPNSPKDKSKYIVAPTCAELGEMLPDYFHSIRDKGCFPNKWIAEMIKEARSAMMDSKFINTISKSADTETNCRAKMLIYLKEKKLI